MKTILVIGIGAGNPEHVTIQAVNALNRADAFFIMDKGAEKSGLTDLRREICRRYITHDGYRFVDAASPDWDRRSSDYLATVDGLNSDKQAVFERLIGEELQAGECGAFLIWGDPSLYDSTIRILEAIAAGGRHDFDYEIIPGITSVQALTASHRTTLNRIGQPALVTTGRRLADRFPDLPADSTVVMLDGGNSYRQFAGQDVDIYWGAYVGTPDEILIAGKLNDVAAEIERTRAEARKKHGWIMDIYLMRRNDR